MIYLAFYIIFIAIHIFGVGEALKLMFIITAVAALALGVFLVAMVPHFDVANLLDIPVTTAVGASPFLPFGYVPASGRRFPMCDLVFPRCRRRTAGRRRNQKSQARPAARSDRGDAGVADVRSVLILIVGPGRRGRQLVA